MGGSVGSGNPIPQYLPSTGFILADVQLWLRSASPFSVGRPGVGTPDRASWVTRSMTQSTLTEYQSSGSEPYKDKELLRRLYIDEDLTQKEISDRFGCSSATVSKYLREFDIPTRMSAAEAKQYAPANFYMHDSKYEAWRSAVNGERKTIFVHRLLAIHKYGFDAVCDMQVHHINGIPWDNREENIELMTIGEHSTHHHTKVEGIDRLRVAELYENGDISYRRLHDVLDYDEVTWHTLMTIHKEFYGE